MLASCISDIPAHLSQAFELRELKLLPISEICGTVGISAKNVSVRLHRARLLLRECLEKGIVSEQMLRQEMRRNHVRHDALEVIERTPPLAA